MDMIFQIMEASEKIVKLVKYFKFVGPSMQGSPEVHYSLTTVWLEELSGKPSSVGWPYGP